MRTPPSLIGAQFSDGGGVQEVRAVSGSHVVCTFVLNDVMRVYTKPAFLKMYAHARKQWVRS